VVSPGHTDSNADIARGARNLTEGECKKSNATLLGAERVALEPGLRKGAWFATEIFEHRRA
jgi:hypothetical protein